jgi:enoyl-CoA hydratase/carnithine racemase
MTSFQTAPPASIGELPMPVTLDESTLADLRSAFVMLRDDQAVQQICLTGGATHFSIGVSLDLFFQTMSTDDHDRLLRFTRSAHVLQSEIERCTKPVIAWVRGQAVGGGVELILACHKIVGGPKSRFFLPETGLGLYPGMGGTQRTVRRIGVGLAKWMIYTGAIIPAEQALAIGLIDAIADDSSTIAEACEALDRPALRAGQAGTRPPQMASVERLFAEHTVDELVAMPLDSVSDPRLVRALVQVRAKSPVALALSQKIIDAGLGLPQDDGIALEFSHLRDALVSEEARAKLVYGRTAAK